jgi:hypothetical protein
MQEISVKAGGKQSNRLAKISNYIGHRREVVNSKSVPVGSLVGQNEPPVRIGSDTQPSEPIGDKNWITNIALKRTRYVALGADM